MFNRLKNHQHRPLSEVLDEIQRKGEKTSLNLDQLIEILGDQYHGILILYLTIPFFLPIPIPGLSVIFGLIIASIALAWVFGADPWMPRSWRKRELPKTLTTKAPDFGKKIFSKIEVFIRPRLFFMHDWLLSRLLSSLVIIAAALFLALPLPPGTNFPPALLIFIMSLSIISRDGLLGILGMVLFVVEVFIFAEAADYLWSVVSKWF